MATKTAPAFINTLALLMATKQQYKANMDTQRQLCVAEFPDFNDMEREFTKEEFARMDELCSHLYQEAGELHKLEIDTIELAYNQICEHFRSEAPDKQLRKMMDAVLGYLSGKPEHFPQHRIVAWALNGFKNGIPSTQEAFKVLDAA